MKEIKEKPILFSGEMVQALLNTKPNVWPAEPIDPTKPWKWQTRRICKDIAGVDFEWGLDREPYIGNYEMFTKTEPRKWGWVTLENQWLYDQQTAIDASRTYLLKCPYEVGQKLWVKETFGYDNMAAFNKKVYYKSDDNDPDIEIHWKSPRFMPKAAARIWLEVKGVRMEKLQSITEEDARAEGLRDYKDLTNGGIFCTARENFEGLWNTLNAKSGRGWDVNDWVFVYEFMRG